MWELRLGWLMCSLSLIRGLGRCGTEAWMADVFSLGCLMCSLSLIRGLDRCGTEAWMADVFSLAD